MPYSYELIIHPFMQKGKKFPTVSAHFLVENAADLQVRSSSLSFLTEYSITLQNKKGRCPPAVPLCFVSFQQPQLLPQPQLLLQPQPLPFHPLFPQQQNRIIIRIMIHRQLPPPLLKHPTRSTPLTENVLSHGRAVSQPILCPEGKCVPEIRDSNRRNWP